MKNVNLLIAGIIAFIVVSVTMAFSTIQQDGEWKVPEAAKNRKNPYADDKALLSVGKSLYMKHCKSCHGKEGLGDGSKASDLDTPSGDFSADEFQDQTDGSIFYKTQIGRDDMPSFKKKIPDNEDLWSIVNFIRTLEE